MTDEDKPKEIRVNCPLFKCNWFFTTQDPNAATKAEWEHWVDFHTEKNDG